MATQRTRIYLEGIELDLDKNVDIDFTYSIADIADFEKRTTTFSKTVNIPGTAHNNFIFGNYFDFNISNDFTLTLDNSGVNFNPLKKAFVKVTLDNVEIFAGVLRLLEITSIDGVLTYQCALFGSLGGLFSTIGDKLLTQLDLSDLDHTYNIATIKGTWDGNDPYVYPLAQYGLGTNATDSTYDVLNFRPAIKVKEVFDRIITQAGYTYNTTLWDSNNLDKLILLNPEEIFTASYGVLAEGNFTETVNGGFLFADEYTVNLLTYNNGSSDPYPTPRFINNTSTAVNFNLTLKLDVDFMLGFGDMFEFKIYTRDETTLDIVAIKNVPLDNWVFNEINFQSNFTLNPSQSLIFGFSVYNTIPPTFNIEGTYIIKDTSTFKMETDKRIPVTYGSSISGISIVPDNVRQSDFLKSIINLLNLYIVQDKDDEFKLTFIPYPDFYTNEIVDWTDKKDLDKGFSIKPPSEFLAKNFLFNYKDDSDYYSKLYKNKYGTGYGNLIYDTGNEFSKDQNSTELIFSLAPLISNINHNRVLSAMFDINPDGTYKQIKTNPKLAFYGGELASTQPYTIKNGAITLSTETTYAYAGHVYSPTTAGSGDLWDITFDVPKEVYFNTANYPTNNLFVKYYEQFLIHKTNKDSKLVILYFLLNTVDMANLDFQKFYKVDNGLYYLNKVDGYNPLGNELTKVELLRIA